MSAKDAGAVMGMIRPGPPALWAVGQGLLIGSLTAAVLIGARNLRR